MHLKTIATSFAISAAMVAMPLAAGALSVSCVGTPATSTVSWVATSANATGTVSYLWGNGSTAASQVVAVGPGTYTMTLQATDATSTATTSCAATVATPAPTTPGVNAQIAALLAQINALKAQIFALASGQGTSTPSTLPPGLGKVCDRIESNLSRGKRGGDVEKLQRFLARQGLIASSTVTGTFGPQTERALRRLQRENGMKEDGVFGSSTLKFFEKHCDGDDRDDRNEHMGRPTMGTTTASTTKPAINLRGRGHENEDHDRRNGRDD